MMLSLTCVSVENVGLPSVVMRVHRGEVQCCGLSKVWNARDDWNMSRDVDYHA
jgi:hypothetical protein